MLIWLKVLVFLWSVNLAPPLLAHLLEERWGGPLDRGLRFGDGRPLLGPHKTSRRLIAAVATAAVAGPTLGFPLPVSLAAGLLSMLGDLLTSFCKRRLDHPSGGNLPGVDQALEGALPFLVLTPHGGLSPAATLAAILVFSLGAYAGSHLLKDILRAQPFEGYPRLLKSSTRLRELKRCQVQSSPWTYVLNLKSLFMYRWFMQPVFRLSGIEAIGRKNALDLQVRRLDFSFPDLPQSFHGYTILFLTDLHLDGLEGLTERLEPLLRKLPADLCLLGGDYRMEEYGSFTRCLQLMTRLAPAISARDGSYSVLGNHDCLEMVEPLGELGVRFLINDAVAIRRGGERIWIVGVDDPHYYCCDNLEEAFGKVEPGAFSVLLAHSPEIFREAAGFGPRLYLCGHTHAGQIQLPGIGPISTHMRGPRFVAHGPWTHAGMQGYTSAGVGISGAPVRLWSRGEVVLVTLRRSEP